MATAPSKLGFTTVSVRPVSAGFGVFLDNRALRTPVGIDLAPPTERLAMAIADEWRAGGRRPKSEQIPLTRMAGTALDRMAPRRAEFEAQLLTYAETELLCYRAEQPPDLAARQAAVWQPLLDWLVQRHDALLTPTTGIATHPQPPASLAALRSALAKLDPWRMAALSVAVGASSSLVIGLALLDGRLDPAGGFDAAELDSTWQIERWGLDEDARIRRDSVRADLDLVARFVALLD